MFGTISAKAISFGALTRVNRTLLAGSALGAVLALAALPHHAFAACVLSHAATTDTYACTGSDASISQAGTNTNNIFNFTNQAVTAGGASFTATPGQSLSLFRSIRGPSRCPI